METVCTFYQHIIPYSHIVKSISLRNVHLLLSGGGHCVTLNKAHTVCTSLLGAHFLPVEI